MPTAVPLYEALSSGRGTSRNVAADAMENGTAFEFSPQMTLLHQNLSGVSTSKVSQAIFVVLAGVLVRGITHRWKQQPHINVPAVGAAGFFGFYYGSLRFIFDAGSMIEEGYRKLHGQTFKIPELGKWRVIICKPELIEEVRRAPDDIMSFQASIQDTVAAKYTLGSLVTTNAFHFKLIRVHFPRKFSLFLPDIIDEIVSAFDEAPFGRSTDWTPFPALHSLTEIVVRITDRILIGKPLCRDSELIHLTHHYSEDVVKAGIILNLFPRFLRPFVYEYLTPVPTNIRRIIKILEPMIEHRIRQQDEYGTDGPDKPNDILSWLIDDAKAEARSPAALTQYLLATIFAAVHTTSMTLTHALYQLAVSSEYIEPLRKEVLSAVDDGGYTKDGLGQMRLLDSFIKETMRLHGIGVVALQRIVLQDYTLSDGTFLPAGTFLYCSSACIHHDEAHYEDANTFKPFRFYNPGETPGEENAKHISTTPSTSFLAFSYGKHACPGRFFAVAQIKAIMAHILLNYDFKMGGDGTFPPNVHFGPLVIPNQNAQLVFRRRTDSGALDAGKDRTLDNYLDSVLGPL